MQSDRSPEHQLLQASADRMVMPDAVRNRLIKRFEPRPAAWVPSAYFAEGVPFALVIWVAGTMFKDLGYSDGSITLVVGSIGVTWSLKPLWVALLDMFKTKKYFVLASEFSMAAVLAAIGLALQVPNHFYIVVTGLWILAFASATHDTCVDGIYLTVLDDPRQASWIGAQDMCWNGGRIFATAGVVGVAGLLKKAGYPTQSAWLVALGLSALSMLVLAIYHHFALPVGSIPKRPSGVAEVARRFGDALGDFARKAAIARMLTFVVLYRVGESFLLVEAPLFLQASEAAGGLGLTLNQKALLDGTLSSLVSIGGGLLGGAFVARFGLRRSLFFLALCLNVPHVCYVFLSHAASVGVRPSLATILVLVSIEKFGYSFGFVGSLLYMMQQLAPGKYRMTHYAFATALMNLALVPTQMLSGPLADFLGYRNFFIFVLIASVPSILAAWQAPFPVPPDEERPGHTRRVRPPRVLPHETPHDEAA